MHMLCPGVDQANIIYRDIQCTQEATVHPCEAELKAHLFQEIQNHTRVKRNGQEYMVDHNFVIFGQSVCKEAWCRVNNVSYAKFSDMLERLKGGNRNVSHGNLQLRSRQRSVKASEAIGWMKNRFKAIGDLMPNRDEVCSYLYNF